jgi:hypothetical protein
MSDLRVSGASASARTETDIRLNYGDPSKIIAAANDANSLAEAVFFSTDGGANWSPSTTNLPLAAGDAGQSDPAVDWTSDGIAHALCIGFDAGQINLRTRAYQSTDNGATWAFEATLSGAQNGADREIIWVDHSPTSPFRDQVYATWHNGVPVFFARRTAGAGGAWQAAVQLSGAETTVMGIGGDIKTNSFGDLFVFWPDADGTGNLVVRKSIDGGQIFTAPVIIANTFATTRRLSIPATVANPPATRGARVYISAGAYRTATKDLVYAVWSDLSGAAGCTTGGGPGNNVASTCKTRVWFSRSTNGGANGTWSAPVMLNNQASLNDQFHAKLCLDESNGNLMVTYRDTVNNASRLQADVWMQTSTDDGVTWSAAVRVTSAASDETTAGFNPNQYADYDGLSGFYGNFFPAWTDRRTAGAEEIWTSQLTLIQKQLFFIVDKSTFGQDEVGAMLAQGNATVNAAFYVGVEGFTATELGIITADLTGPPVHKPTLTPSPSVMDMTIGEPTALLAEDMSLPATTQRFTWVYPVSFTSANGFTQPVITVTLNATMSTVAGSGVIQLLQQPDPYELDGQTHWLSTDLRVFQIKTNQSKFGATVGGSTPTDAINFIRQVITNLNPGGNSGGQTFENDLDPNATEVALYQTDTSGTAVFNFAIAKVRYRAIAQDAQAVRVFFRLCPALTVSLAYDPSTTYRTYSDGVQYGQKIARLGTQNNNILTIPCFATARFTPGASMDTQTDIPNVQMTIAHNTTGAEIDRYFGCWLDINQPLQTHFPINPTNNGPYSGSLKSVLELVRNQHQCLVAEIAFDPDPISTGATPGTSDKLAQRNLSLVASANPGEVTSRRIPNAFEFKPTPGPLLQGPDELMIDWGNTPVGSVARIYLPTVSVDEILEFAAKQYSAAKLTRIDDHTVECEVHRITYIPIPPGPSLNHTGLLTIDLPPGVRKGQMFHIIVRQITHAGRAIPVPQEPQIDVRSSVSSLAATQNFNWRQVLGTFQISIPVQSKEVMLEPEERLLSVLRWILQSIPLHDRWYLVFSQYVEEIADRVRGLGGDPDQIQPSPNGEGISLVDVWCRRIAWLVVVFLALWITLLGLAFATPASLLILLIGIVLLTLIVVWQWRCKPDLCTNLWGLLLGAAGGAGLLGLAVLGGLGGPTTNLVLAASGIAVLILSLVAMVRGCPPFFLDRRRH